MRGCRDIEQLLEPWLDDVDGDEPTAESLATMANDATPPSIARCRPEPYPPPDEFDLPSPDPNTGDDGDDG